MKNIGKGFENCIGIYCIKCYRNLNNKLRKDGIYYMRVRKFLIYRIDISIDLVKLKYPKYADYAVPLSN